MRKIIAAALSVILVVAVSFYFGSSTTGLFYASEIESGEENFDAKNSKWEFVGKIEIKPGNVSSLT
jgi:Mg2+/Co2+ transporter CorB